MKTTMLMTAATLFLGASMANVACIITHNQVAAPLVDESLPRASFEFEHSTTIPDGAPDGVTIGPLMIAAGAPAIQDVVLCLEITHAYAGDLSLMLHYDNDNDGDFDVSSAIDLHLARVDDPTAKELYGVPVELGGTYFFKDEGWLAAGEEVSFAAAFDGQPGGGSFYLTVIDLGEGNTGAVAGWTVEVRGVKTLEAADLLTASL